MGKTYIKEEGGKKALYEEGTFIFGDKKLGDLHENFDGSLETRNAFGEDYTIKQERTPFSDLFPIPGAREKDYDVETSEGRSGTLKHEDWFRHRHEGELKSRENDEEREEDSHGSYSSSDSSNGSSSSSSESSSERKPREEVKSYQPSTFLWFLLSVCEGFGWKNLEKGLHEHMYESAIGMQDHSNAAHFAEKYLKDYEKAAWQYYLLGDVREAVRCYINAGNEEEAINILKGKAKYNEIIDIVRAKAEPKKLIELYYMAGLYNEGYYFKQGADLAESTGNVRESLRLLYYYRDSNDSLYESSGKTKERIEQLEKRLAEKNIPLPDDPHVMREKSIKDMVDRKNKAIDDIVNRMPGNKAGKSIIKPLN